jgi:hypothetical protein
LEQLHRARERIHKRKKLERGQAELYYKTH